MPPVRSYRKCEICGVRTRRIDKEKRKFMARLPLDETRCRQWVKIIGNEDLAYVPIEKLHHLKYVCGDHFQHKDFNRKKSRLKRRAIPSVGIRMEALSDDLLEQFPYHIYKSNEELNHITSTFSTGETLTITSDAQRMEHSEKNINHDHDYCKSSVVLHAFPNPVNDPERFTKWVSEAGLSGEDDNYIYRNRRICHLLFEEIFHYLKNRLNRLAILTLHLSDILSKFKVTVRTPKHSETLCSTSKGRAAVTNKKAAKAGPALFEDSAKPADIVNAADIINSTDITNTADITDSTDIQDGDINDGDTQEETDEQLFSWQRDSEINCDDFDINTDNTIATVQDSAVTQIEYGDTVGGNSLQETRSETEDQSLNKDEEKDLHEGYKCDMCNGPIYRFRYSCVECANYDLCGACEARAAHPQHYLLRVPRPRPHGEIQLIMDTIRRFITADPKSLRAEANFVSTLMDELKSEVLSEAGSDPVPDEPDYPIESDDSTVENEDCEMTESNATHTPATQDDDVQVVDRLDEEFLEEWEFPRDIYKTQEIVVSKDVNVSSDRDRDRDPHSRSHEQNKPERCIVNKIDSPSSSNTLGKVNKRIFLTHTKTVPRSDAVCIQHIPGRIVSKIDYPSPSNTSGKVGERILVSYPKIGSISDEVIQHERIVRKIDALSPSKNLGRVSKRTLVTCPKSVSISDDVMKLLKTKDGDPMQRTINTIKHTLQSKVSVPLQRLSNEEIKSATKS